MPAVVLMSNHEKLIVFVVALVASTVSIPVAFAEGTAPDIGSVITSVFTNPTSILIFLIELFLGLGLGYFSAKIVKYMLALIAIFIVGLLLNIWAIPNLGTSLQNELGNLSAEWSKLYPVLTSIIYLVGITTILPITVGFVIGILLAILR